MKPSQSAWTLLELLVVLALIALLSLFVFSAEQASQRQLLQRPLVSLLLQSSEEARSRAMEQRLTTWLILQHGTSGKDSFALFQEQENGELCLIASWKELPKDIHVVLLPLGNNTLPESLKLPPNLCAIKTQLSGIAWNHQGNIIAPSEIPTLNLLTNSNKKIGQILFLKNSGRAHLVK
jgi:prepilin-type N-terminal cleavage/methylation domain-containing protein